MSCEEKNYLDSCKGMAEIDHDIKEAGQCKQKIQDILDEVNGELLVMQKCYKYLETRNMCLKAAYVRKLKFSAQKVVDKKKSDTKTDVEFEQINNDELVSACEKAEAGEREVKVEYEK